MLKFPVLCQHYFNWLRTCVSRCTRKTLKLDLFQALGWSWAGVIYGACQRLWHHVPSCNFLGSLGTHYTDIITSLKTRTTVCTYAKHSSCCRSPALTSCGGRKHAALVMGLSWLTEVRFIIPRSTAHSLMFCEPCLCYLAQGWMPHFSISSFCSWWFYTGVWQTIQFNNV